MKLLRASLLTLCIVVLGGCDSAETTAFDKLKAETGASDAELEEGIKSFTKFYTLMRDEIEAGTINVEDFVDATKNAKEIMATAQRDDESTAIFTLAYLRALEEDGKVSASEMMSRQLTQFVEAEFPITDISQRIREKILEYAKTSPSLKAINPQSEQNAAEQPATTSESK